LSVLSALKKYSFRSLFIAAASDWITVNNKGERIRKETGVTYFKIFSQYSYKGTEEKHKESQENGRRTAKFETAIPPLLRPEEFHLTKRKWVHEITTRVYVARFNS
jgi:hypothetical protein